MVSLVSLAIPFFFLLIGVELLASRLMKRRVYRLNDSIDDLNCGTISQLRGIFTKVITFGAYLLCFAFGRETLGLPELGADRWYTWVLALLGVDFAYYWFHRWSHEVNFLWAAHVVHHQSEEYNLAVALRQSAIQGMFSFFVYLPLALVGVPPALYVLSKEINLIYQFWIHTRLIKRMGPFGWVFNTPSHHRVHHGADPKYLDRNYAGVLIIWDRMFGTFLPEEEEPTYGTTKPLARWNPLWANFDYWAQLVRQARTMDRTRDKLWLFFAHPGWRPEQPVPNPPEVRGRALFDADTSPARKAYLFAQYLGMLVVTVGLLFGGKHLDLAANIMLSVWITASAVAIGVGFENRPSFAWLEATRLLLLPAMAAAILVPMLSWGPTAMAAVGAAAGFALLSLLPLAVGWLSAPAIASEAPDPSAAE